MPVNSVDVSAPLLGALPRGETTRVSVWAPLARSVEVRGRGRDARLECIDGEFWTGETHVTAGDDYWLVLDGERLLADPCSRRQPEGLRGPSRVVDSGTFEWTDGTWKPPALEELVIYELHVGTFTQDGTFDAAVEHLPQLVELGVTAVEVMPVATFPGRRGWGYDGVFTYAPHEVYGGPHGLARFVDAAHAAGLAVLLDVVYNHIGPGSELISAFGPYLTDARTTIWGESLDYSLRGVREWAVQNAELWVRDFHVDGLRLDATHAIFDESEPHLLRELADRVHVLRNGILVTSEMEIGDLRPIREWGHDAQWADALHHAVHVLLTGEQEGYYEHYGRVGDVAVALQAEEQDQLIVCAQNHDQVGNRALGDRQHGDALRLAAFAAVLSSNTPLLFMGEEYDEPNPFQFFTDHDDPAIAQATRDGRRREFERFTAFAGEDVPDPQAEATFLRSKLDRRRGDDATRAYYRELVRVRRELGRAPLEVVEVDEPRRFLRARRGRVELLMNFSEVCVDGVPPVSGEVRRPE
jgi:maltooligosyltrehalose trehalohydrolase